MTETFYSIARLESAGIEVLPGQETDGDEFIRIGRPWVDGVAGLKSVLYTDYEKLGRDCFRTRPEAVAAAREMLRREIDQAQAKLDKLRDQLEGLE